jgi:hypothetical protein
MELILYISCTHIAHSFLYVSKPWSFQGHIIPNYDSINTQRHPVLTNHFENFKQDRKTLCIFFLFLNMQNITNTITHETTMKGPRATLGLTLPPGENTNKRYIQHYIHIQKSTSNHRAPPDRGPWKLVLIQ